MAITTAQEKWNAFFLSKNRRTIAVLRKQVEQMNDEDLASRPMGIYVLSAKKCGCIIKSYAGGRVVTVGCKLHPSTIRFVCPATNCGALFNVEKEFREHKWSHGY